MRVSFLQPDHAARHWTLHNIHIAHFLCPYHPSSSRLRVPKQQFSCNCSYYYSQFTYRRVQDKWERISAMKSQVVVRTAPRRPCKVAKLLPGSANCANSPAWPAPAAPAAQILQAGLAARGRPSLPGRSQALQRFRFANSCKFVYRALEAQGRWDKSNH